jgi:replicative DNA helicase
MERRVSGQDTALPTGFADLDAMLSGGLNPGNLVFVAARPSMGKTSFALQVAQNAARAGKTALFCSMEMSGIEVSYRQQAVLANVTLPSIVAGNLTEGEYGQVGYAIQQIAAMPLYIDDQGGLTFADVAMKARQVKRRAGGLDLVVVDYLQLMHAKGDNRNAEIEQISRALKGMAKDLEIPVVVLSQLNRQVENRPNKRPILADLRDSGAIEQDADVVLMLYRDDVYNENSLDANTAEVLIRKHRQGKTGNVQLAWRGETASFGDLDQDSWRRNREQEKELREMARRAEKRTKERAF